MSDSTKKWLHNLISLANIGALIGQILQVLPPSPKVMALQTVYQLFAPSLFGIGHTLVFGGKQESVPPPATKP